MPNGMRRPDAPGASSEPLIPRKNDVLAEICRAIARSGDHREVVQESAERLQRYFGTHAVAILFESDSDLLVEGMAFPDHLRNLVPEIRTAWDVRSATPDRPAVQAMRQRQILRWDAEDPSLTAEVRALLRRGSARTLIAIPIYVDGDPIGACMVATPDEKPLSTADEALIETALGVVGVVYRRGELKDLEAEHQRRAIQAHHLAAVGELAAGVAHEINNPLNTVVQFCELLLQGELDAEARGQVQAILDEALRAARTVGSLQNFARSEGGGRAVASVEESVRAILELEHHQLAVSNVAVQAALPPDLPRVRADAAHLRRVLHNVLSNARQAIRDTGVAGHVVIHAAHVGRWVEIAVEDTGPGLTPEVADAMFRPFFTTRPTGQGAGLGLAVANGIVREHGGEIEGTNWGHARVNGGAPGQGGARIVIRLPADVEPWLPASPPAAAPEPGRARGLSILLVEDEPEVARAVAALLTHEGHRVEIATRAEQAVTRLRAGVRYDVILSDIRMPGVGGEGLYTWIRTEQPELVDRLLFMSGDLLSPRTEAFLERANRPVLAKPFTLAALRSALAPFGRAISGPGDG